MLNNTQDIDHDEDSWGSTHRIIHDIVIVRCEDYGINHIVMNPALYIGVMTVHRTCHHYKQEWITFPPIIHLLQKTTAQFSELHSPPSQVSLAPSSKSTQFTVSLSYPISITHGRDNNIGDIEHFMLQ